MKKFWNWINKNIILICCIFLLLFTFRTCSVTKNVKKLTKELKQVETKIDSLKESQITARDLKIEGLKSEKRMIQSTDRKKFDLDRENAIDIELEKLENQ